MTVPTIDAGVPTSPATARTVDVVDHDFGIDVADPYRWMEGNDNPELTAWLRVQGERAEKLLAQIPGRDRLRARVRQLGLGVTAVFDVQIAGSQMFYKEVPAHQQLARLMVRDKDGKDRVLVDPAEITATGSHASLEAYSASPDGAKVSYVVATGGGEVGVLHVMDVATGKDLPDQLERIWGEGSASWLPDSKSFYYNQLAVPRPNVDPMLDQSVKHHVLGQPVDRDVTVLGKGADGGLQLAAEEWPGMWIDPGTQWVIATIGGAHSEMRAAVAKLSEIDDSGAGKTPWRVVAGYADGVEGVIARGDRLYIKTYKEAPNRRIVSTSADHPDLAKAKIELAEAADATIVGLNAARDALYIKQNNGGHAKLLRLPWGGKIATPLALPVDGWAPDSASDPQRDGLVFQIETWLAPGKYYAYDPRTNKVSETHLASSTDADTTNVIADEVEATSADGTKVPLSIIHVKDVAHDGKRPAIIYAYGAYGSTEYPGFSATRIAWLELGGVIAVAHVRGGGEKGRRWQDEGSRDKKLAGVHDLIACAQYLIDNKLTVSNKLAIQGASMGGVLVGRALTERPDLFGAVSIGSGIVNPLRIMHAENGANQKAELGDPETEAGYRSILKMDPYEHVSPRIAYPAVIFTVGLHDHRVAPWMTTKMAARLMALSTSGKPIAIRVDADAGHGIGSTRDQAFDQRADMWSFFLWVFGDAG